MSYIENDALAMLNVLVKQAKINALKNTDAEAYSVYQLYDYWPNIPEGTYLKAREIVSHSDNILYRVKDGQGHPKQSSWAPDTASSLFTPIPRSGETGTIDNPITWVSGMESEEGKYYIDEGAKYLCIESSGIGLYGQPKDLPRYFQVVI